MSPSRRIYAVSRSIMSVPRIHQRELQLRVTHERVERVRRCRQALAFQNFCDFARRLVGLFALVAKLVKGGKRLCLIVVHETQQEIVGMFRDEPKRRESSCREVA